MEPEGLDRDILEMNVLVAIMPLLQQRKADLETRSPVPLEEYTVTCIGLRNCELELDNVIDRIFEYVPY